jgi:hypothetical protein
VCYAFTHDNDLNSKQLVVLAHFASMEQSNPSVARSVMNISNGVADMQGAKRKANGIDVGVVTKSLRLDNQNRRTPASCEPQLVVDKDGIPTTSGIKARFDWHLTTIATDIASNYSKMQSIMNHSSNNMTERAERDFQSTSQ